MRLETSGGRGQPHRVTPHQNIQLWIKNSLIIHSQNELYMINSQLLIMGSGSSVCWKRG